MPDPEEGVPVDCVTYSEVPDVGSSHGGHGQPATIGGEAIVATLKTVDVDFGYLATATYAAGIGALRLGVTEFDGSFHQLEYARIGVAEYGTPVVAAAAPPAPAAPALEAWPNPTAGRRSVRLTLRAAGPARVAALDALGREVALLHDGPLPAGSHAFRVNGRGLAPGAYVIRASAGTWMSHALLIVTR